MRHQAYRRRAAGREVGKSACLYRSIKDAGLFGGFDPKLLCQPFLTNFKEPQSGRPLPRPGVKAHELPVNRLMEGIERESLPGEANGLPVISAAGVALDEPLERFDLLLQQLLRLKKLPLVKLRRISEGKTGQESVAITGYPARQP